MVIHYIIRLHFALKNNMITTMILIARSDNKYSYTVDMHSSIVNNESLYVAFTQKKTDT